jgi:ribosome modulation factor
MNTNYAYSEGYLAGENRAMQSHNPYEKGEPEWRDWMEGWQDAMDDGDLYVESLRKGHDDGVEILVFVIVCVIVVLLSALTFYHALEYVGIL